MILFDNICVLWYNKPGSFRNRALSYAIKRLSPSFQRVKLLFPSVQSGRGDAEMITYSDFFVFCTFIVSLISLIIQITKKK